MMPTSFPKADQTLCRWQRIFLLLLLIGIGTGAYWGWRVELLCLNGFFTAFYLVSTLHRMVMIQAALSHSSEITVSSEEMAAITEWPRYIILLPLFREAAILPHLVESLAKLDYPANRLDIRLLIEEDDQETMAAARTMPLPPQFHIYPIPFSLPRTKPKACNVALAQGEAEFLVIYDAEDRPDPQQLKKAVCAFRKLDAATICLQGKLDYYNTNQNFLTKCFTAEYATWFGLCLPGLSRLKAPLPLGGTSNHFRLEQLRQAGGWDEYNVTEDCDLGLRLFEQGYRTAVLDSTTYEQACGSLFPWIRQRSRWIKGYIQTWLVHTRHLNTLHRRLGFWNSLQFHLLIGGTFLSLLLNPIYWLLTLLWIVWRPAGVQAFFPLPIFIASAFCLFAGNFVFLYATMIACVRRNHPALTRYALAMPLYWLLMSIGAWKGFLQLLHAPHHWEKTPHHSQTPSFSEETSCR